MKKVVFMIGPSGSGKSSIADVLSKFHRFMVVKPGKLCREKFDHHVMASSQNPSAAPVAEDFVRKVLLDSMKKFINDGSMDYLVVDGMPRSADQANWIHSLFEIYNAEVIFLWVSCPLPVAIKRLSGRDGNGLSELSVARLEKEGKYLYEAVSQVLELGYSFVSIHNDGRGNVFDTVIANYLEVFGDECLEKSQSGS